MRIRSTFQTPEHPEPWQLRDTIALTLSSLFATVDPESVRDVVAFHDENRPEGVPLVRGEPYRFDLDSLGLSVERSGAKFTVDAECDTITTDE